MTDTDETPSRERAEKRPGRRSTRNRPLARIWTEWRTEFIILLVVAVAVFLLVERLQIRRTLFAWLRTVAQGLGSAVEAVLLGAVGLVRNTTLSDLIGYGLLLLVAVLVAWRLRWRLMHMARLTTKKCPLCHSNLQRIHRRWYDRLLNPYLPVRRYRCHSPDCSWSGLRIGHKRS
jgi:hypothetical protein